MAKLIKHSDTVYRSPLETPVEQRPIMAHMLHLDLTMNTTAATRVVQERDERDDVDDLDPECFETFEDTKEKLEEVERDLAKRLKLPRGVHVRRRLIALDRCGKLVEDELVSRWHDLYSSYVDWLEFEGYWT